MAWLVARPNWAPSLIRMQLPVTGSMDHPLGNGVFGNNNGSGIASLVSIGDDTHASTRDRT